MSTSSPYQAPSCEQEAERLVAEMQAKLADLDVRIIRLHEAGDHEAGDELRKQRLAGGEELKHLVQHLARLRTR